MHLRHGLSPQWQAVVSVGLMALIAAPWLCPLVNAEQVRPHEVLVGCTLWRNDDPCSPTTELRTLRSNDPSNAKLAGLCRELFVGLYDWARQFLLTSRQQVQEVSAARRYIDQVMYYGYEYASPKLYQEAVRSVQYSPELRVAFGNGMASAEWVVALEALLHDDLHSWPSMLLFDHETVSSLTMLDYLEIDLHNHTMMHFTSKVRAALPMGDTRHVTDCMGVDQRAAISDQHDVDFYEKLLEQAIIMAPQKCH